MRLKTKLVYYFVSLRDLRKQIQAFFSMRRQFPNPFCFKICVQIDKPIFCLNSIFNYLHHTETCLRKSYFYYAMLLRECLLVIFALYSKTDCFAYLNVHFSKEISNSHYITLEKKYLKFVFKN